MDKKAIEEIGLLLAWIDIARQRGIEAADKEMHDNLDNWTTKDSQNFFNQHSHIFVKKS
jgi:hypothetical protein